MRRAVFVLVVAASLVGVPSAPASTSLTPPLDLRWADNIPSPATNPGFATPAVLGSTVFVAGWRYGDEPAAWALDRATGAVLWGPVTIGDVYGGGNPWGFVTLDGNRLFAASEDGGLAQIDPTTGTVLWQTSGAGETQPVAAGGTVFTTQTEWVKAFNESDGSVKWQLDLHDHVSNLSPPIVSGGVLYVASAYGTAYAIDPATGAIRWQSTVFADDESWDKPSVAVTNGQVEACFGSDRGQCATFDAATGASLGTFQSVLPPAFASGVGFYVTPDHHLSAHDLSTGSTLWTFSDDSVYTVPVVSNGVVYVLGGTNLYGIDAASGRVLWSTTSGAGVDTYVRPTDSEPVVTGDLLIVPELCQLHCNAQLFAYGTPGPAGGTPPANDRFANAEPADNTNGFIGDTTWATPETGEPEPATGLSGRTVWFRLRYANPTTVTMDTNGSAFDTALAVYTGSTVSALQRVAANDDVTPGVRTSQLQFSAQANTTYYVELDGRNTTRAPGGGAYVINVRAIDATPPANDNFASATDTAGNLSQYADTANATVEPGEPTIMGNAGGHSVWYTVTPSSTGSETLRITCCFDVMAAVYTGTQLSSLTKLAEARDPTGAGAVNMTWHVQAGVTYRVQIDGYNGQRGGLYTWWQFAGGSAPANDAFASAQEIDGVTGSSIGDTTNATRESGEPTTAGNAGGHSVWFYWIPPAEGAVTFDTIGSSFDTTLAVYTGDSLGSLTKVAEDDDSGGNRTSKLTFNAVNGNVYRIQLDGYAGTSGPAWFGNYTLHWSGQTPNSGPGSPPPNDAFETPTVMSGASGTLAGDTTGALRETGDPEILGNPGGRSVWFVWTAPSAGTVTIDTIGSAFDTMLGVYVGSTGGTSATVAEDDDGGGNRTSKVTFDAAAGVTYHVELDGYKGTSGPAWYGAYTLHWSQAAQSTAPAPPANDAFAQAQSVSGSSGTVTGDTTGATRDSGEPTILGNPGGHSVWFSWTATTSGPATVDTVGSSFDTTLAVYTGTTLSSLSKLAEDDDSGGNRTSKLSFNVTAGTTYTVQLDGYAGTSGPAWFGSYTLHWAGAGAPSTPPPTNDAFGSAQRLSGSSGTATGDTTTATREANEPQIVGNAGGHSVWFAWTAPAAGTVTFATVGSAFDTTLAVYTGSGLGSLSKIGENDDSGTGTTSSVQFTATAGTTYYVQLDGYNGTSRPPWYGAYSLSWHTP